MDEVIIIVQDQVNEVNIEVVEDITEVTIITADVGKKGDKGTEVEIRNNGTYIQWKYTTDVLWTNLIALSALIGPAGADGTEIELQKTATHIQWRYVGGAWTNLVALTDITGPSGADGREIEIQNSGTYIQWRYIGTVPWTNIVALTAITGPAGADGTNGTNGTNGTDGREVQLQNSGTYIQWKYDTDISWTNLVALSALKGDKGDDGAKVVSVAFVGSDMVFTLDDSSTVTLTNAKVDLKGDDGATPVSASFVGDDLVFVKDDLATVTILGAKTTLTGPAGSNGTNGTNGTDGKEVQLRVDSGYVQWKYDTDIAWTNLFLISDYITKAAIEAVLTGTITTHTHNYQDRIQDTGTTTYVDTDSTANCVEMKGNGATTAIIAKIKNSSDTEVFQVDANGDLLRNNLFFFKKIGAGSVYVGTNEIHSGRVTPENNNTVIGGSAAKSITGGYNNTIVGYQAALNISTGDQNVIIGNAAGYQLGGADYNVYIGTYSGYNNTGKHKNIFIGMYSGYRQTNATDKLLIANQDYTTAAAELTNSIINGTMAAAVADQILQVNAVVKSYGRRPNLVTKTADYTITNSDEVILIDNTSTGVDGTLPAISATNHGQTYKFKVINFANISTLITTGTDVFDNATNTFTFSGVNEILTIIADFTPATKVWRQL